MHILFNVRVLLLVVVISQSLFVAALLWYATHNRRPGRILSVLIVTICLWLVDHFMRMAGIYRQDPDLYFLPIFYSFSFGPLIWFYVQSLINADFRLSKKHFLHFIPVLLQASLYIVLSCLSYEGKRWYWEHIHQPCTYRIEFDGTWLSLSVYLLLSIRLLKNYQRWAADNFSELSTISLNWLKIILAILFVLCVQWFIEVILRDGYGIYFNYDYSVELLGIILLVLGIAGWKQSSLLVRYEPAATITSAMANEYVIDEEILSKIKSAMEDQQLYLHPTLSLQDVALALGVNAKTISRHINAGFDVSFNEFVNRYRVAEVKRRLEAGDLSRLTMVGIANESGFNSKTTFNRIFKELTGQSPKDYLSNRPKS